MSVVFPPTFSTVLGPILGPFWDPKWSLEASFLRVVFSYVFWTVLGLILGVFLDRFGRYFCDFLAPWAPRAPKGAPKGAQGPPLWSFRIILDLILDHLGPPGGVRRSRLGPIWNSFWCIFGFISDKFRTNRSFHNENYPVPRGSVHHRL